MRPDAPVRPRPLRPGDQICLVAPCRTASADRVAASSAYLEKRGYRVKHSPHLLDNLYYFAGRDCDRADDLMAAFLDDEVSAVFCVRGGYGSGRLLDLVDYDAIASRAKILLGFSDTTALSLALYARARLVSFSGAVTDLDLGRDEPDELTEKSLWRAVTSTHALGELPIESAELETIRAGHAQGPLVPATLALLCSLIGTPYLPDLEGAILLLEDVDEYPYRLDRMLNQLRLAGILGKLAALVLGQFRDCFTAEEMRRSPSLSEMIGELTNDIDIPILSGVPYGHFSRRLVLPVGVTARLDAAAPSLQLVEPALVDGGG